MAADPVRKAMALCRRLTGVGIYFGLPFDQYPSHFTVHSYADDGDTLAELLHETGHRLAATPWERQQENLHLGSDMSLNLTLLRERQACYFHGRVCELAGPEVLAKQYDRFVDVTQESFRSRHGLSARMKQRIDVQVPAADLHALADLVREVERCEKATSIHY